MRRRFVMLDRDGTLIYERHYLADPGQVELLPGVVEGLRALRSLGVGLVVLTNQSGLRRGLFDLAALNQIHQRMNDLLMNQGLKLDGIYFCPHLPEDGCACRKPAVGMAMQAARELDFDPAQGFMVGDKNVDIQLGKNVGARSVLVLTGYGKKELQKGSTHPDHVVASLADLPPIVGNVIAAEIPGSDPARLPNSDVTGKNH